MKRNVYKSFILFCSVMVIISAIGMISSSNESSRETIEIVSEKTLIPGGHSVGIKMDVKGVLVVGLEEIETKDGIVNPGIDAGLQVGDIILSLNGKEVLYAHEVTKILKESNGTLIAEIMRGKDKFKLTVKTLDLSGL